MRESASESSGNCTSNSPAWCGPQAITTQENICVSLRRNPPGTCAMRRMGMPSSIAPPRALTYSAAGSGKRRPRSVRAMRRSLASRAPVRPSQHVNEDLRRGVLDRRVERRYAQRLPDVGAQQAALLVIVEQPGDAAVGRDAELAHPKRRHKAQRAETLSEIQSLSAEERREQIERVGESRRAQVKAIGKAQLEGHAKQKLVRVGADPPHYPQRLAIGADQDVLAVVEVHAVYAHAPGAAAQAARGLENGYGDAALGERDGCGEARPAGADDSYAIQSRPLTLALSPRGEGKLLSGDPGPPRDPELADRRERGALLEHLEAVAGDLVEQRPVDRRHHEARSLCVPVLRRQER